MDKDMFLVARISHLEQLTGIEFRSWSAWCCGRRMPQLEKAKLAADKLDMTLDEFAGALKARAVATEALKKLLKNRA